MKLHWGFIVLTLFIFSSQKTCSANPVAAISTIFKVGCFFFKNSKFISTVYGGKNTNIILNRINQINKEIKDIKLKIEESTAIAAQKLLPEIKKSQKLSILKTELDRSIERINQEYDLFLKYSKTDFSRNSKVTNEAIINWSFWMTNEKFKNQTYRLMNLPYRLSINKTLLYQRLFL